MYIDDGATGAEVAEMAAEQRELRRLPVRARLMIGWLDATYGRGVVTVQAWRSADGRFRIEKHPFADKYMLLDRQQLAGISGSLPAAQQAAEGLAEQREAG